MFLTLNPPCVSRDCEEVAGGRGIARGTPLINLAGQLREPIAAKFPPRKLRNACVLQAASLGFSRSAMT
jgi:hypothetical protein